MNDAQMIALGSMAGGLVTAVLTGVVLILNAVHKNRLEARSASDNAQGIIIDRLEREIGEQKKDFREQQDTLLEIQRMHQDCREESAELRGYITLLYDHAKRNFTRLTTAGIDAEPPPEMPDRKIDDREFRRRTDETNVRHIAYLAAKIDDAPKEPKS